MRPRRVIQRPDPISFRQEGCIKRKKEGAADGEEGGPLKHRQVESRISELSSKSDRTLQEELQEGAPCFRSLDFLAAEFSHVNRV